MPGTASVCVAPLGDAPWKCSLEVLQGTAPAVGCLWPGGTGKMVWPLRVAKTCLVLTLCSHGQAGQSQGPCGEIEKWNWGCVSNHFTFHCETGQ